MGVIQNNINAAMGALSGSLVAGKYIANQNKEIANQNKEIAVKKAEAESEIHSLDSELEKQTSKLTSNLIADKDKNKYVEEAVKNERDVLDVYLEGKSEKAGMNVANISDAISSQNNIIRSKGVYTDDEVKAAENKLGTLSKELEMAHRAKDAAVDAIEARRKLKFDKAAAEARFKALGGK